ncbi:MAG: hypothetical protein V7739_10325 [Motiliproteus sp.]
MKSIDLVREYLMNQRHTNPFLITPAGNRVNLGAFIALYQKHPEVVEKAATYYRTGKFTLGPAMD